MHNVLEFKELQETSCMRGLFGELYGSDRIAAQNSRYEKLLAQAVERFGQGDWRFFSSPGRTELAGNHTDHNNGCVLAASVRLDAVACVKASGASRVELWSDGFSKPFSVELSSLSPRQTEEGKTEALIRGIAAAFEERNYAYGGFEGVMDSDIPQGSGLSSSASVEVLFGTIFNHLFNTGAVPWEEVALIGQYAENRYFGKPCGLMDQMACASGGIVSIDFENPQRPAWERIQTDFEQYGYALVVVNTGGSHSNLTSDYASIRNDMRAVARQFGRETLRGVAKEELFSRIKEIRRATSDRAFLRAVHFIEENDRVAAMVEALKRGDIGGYIELVQESGDSSRNQLQNIFTTHNPAEQGVSVGLALTEKFLGKDGACRVHGGGFAGTIQAYIPVHSLGRYVAYMGDVFGEGAVLPLKTRNPGAVEVA